MPTKRLRFQAPKKEQLTPEEAEESSSTSESGSDAESGEESAQRLPAAQSQVQQAARPKQIPQQKTAAAAKAAPKAAALGVRARLQQSAAAATAARDVDSQLAASPRAAEVVIPVVQVAPSQPEPFLAPSVSPRLPEDSADLGPLPSQSSAELPYSSADLAASSAPDAAVQHFAFVDSPGDAIGKRESAGVDTDFLAAGTADAAAAAEIGVSSAPMGPKATKGVKASGLVVRKGTTKIPGKEDILAQLEAQRAKQAEQLKVEARARQELEDMLLRIERHFKAEQAARRKAEEELAGCRESETSLRGQLEAEVKKRSKEQKQLAAQREEVKGERAALDQMRAEFENELQQARGEMQRAQDALQGAEDQVSVNQEVERSKMERDYQAQMRALSEELNRVRQELSSRTEMMGQEMERWRQTAEATSRAVAEAKNEVMERKKDLDTTKEKMDKLVEKLYLGREKGVELTGAIEHQMHQHHAMWRKDQGHPHPGQGFPKLPQGPADGAHYMQPTGRTPLLLDQVSQGLPEVRGATGKKAPPANVAFGGTLTATRSRVPGDTGQPGLPAQTRPRQVQPQGSDSFLPAIKAGEGILKKQQTGSLAQGAKKGGPGARSLQHQGSDRWAESKRDAGMVAYSARWQ